MLGKNASRSRFTTTRRPECGRAFVTMLRPGKNPCAAFSAERRERTLSKIQRCGGEHAVRRAEDPLPARLLGNRELDVMDPTRDLGVKRQPAQLGYRQSQRFGELRRRTQDLQASVGERLDLTCAFPQPARDSSPQKQDVGGAPVRDRHRSKPPSLVRIRPALLLERRPRGTAVARRCFAGFCWGRLKDVPIAIRSPGRRRLGGFIVRDFALRSRRRGIDQRESLTARAAGWPAREPVDSASGGVAVYDRSGIRGGALDGIVRWRLSARRRESSRSSEDLVENARSNPMVEWLLKSPLATWEPCGA